MLIKCLECGKEMSSEATVCNNCGAAMPRKCPRCYKYTYVGKVDVIHTDAVSKTKVKANLNPLHPFTIANVETKTVHPEYNREIFRGRCRNCNYPGKNTLAKEERFGFTYKGMGKDVLDVLLLIGGICAVFLAICGIVVAYYMISYFFR